MKKFFAAFWLLAALPMATFAQMDDDMYFVPTKKAKVQVREQGFEQESQSVQRSAPTYYSGSTRNVDEYNRMGGYDETLTSSDNDEQQGDYQLTQRMTRFDDYTPTEAYWNGYSQGFNDSRDTYLGWHSPWYVATYYPWYDSWRYPGHYGWYSSWYDPWWYDPWYGYSGWHVGWGWGGFHVGWHVGWNSWAWHRPYYHHRPYYDRWGGGWRHGDWAAHNSHRWTRDHIGTGTIRRDGRTSSAERSGRGWALDGGRASSRSQGASNRSVGNHGSYTPAGARTGNDTYTRSGHTPQNNTSASSATRSNTNVGRSNVGASSNSNSSYGTARSSSRSTGTSRSSSYTPSRSSSSVGTRSGGFSSGGSSSSRSSSRSVGRR